MAGVRSELERPKTRRNENETTLAQDKFKTEPDIEIQELTSSFELLQNKLNTICEGTESDYSTSKGGTPQTRSLCLCQDTNKSPKVVKGSFTSVLASQRKGCVELGINTDRPVMSSTETQTYIDNRDIGMQSTKSFYQRNQTTQANLSRESLKLAKVSSINIDHKCRRDCSNFSNEIAPRQIDLRSENLVSQEIKPTTKIKNLSVQRMPAIMIPPGRVVVQTLNLGIDSKGVVQNYTKNTENVKYIEFEKQERTLQISQNTADQPSEMFGIANCNCKTNECILEQPDGLCNCEKCLPIIIDTPLDFEHVKGEDQPSEMFGIANCNCKTNECILEQPDGLCNCEKCLPIIIDTPLDFEHIKGEEVNFKDEILFEGSKEVDTVKKMPPKELKSPKPMSKPESFSEALEYHSELKEIVPSNDEKTKLDEKEIDFCCDENNLGTHKKEDCPKCYEITTSGEQLQSEELQDFEKPQENKIDIIQVSQEIDEKHNSEYSESLTPKSLNKVVILRDFCDEVIEELNVKQSQGNLENSPPLDYVRYCEKMCSKCLEHSLPKKKEVQKSEGKIIAEVKNVNQELDNKERCFSKIKQVKQDEKTSVLYVELVKNLSCACDELIQFISDSKHSVAEKGPSREPDSKSSETSNKNIDSPDEEKVTNTNLKNIFETTEGDKSFDEPIQTEPSSKYSETLEPKSLNNVEILKDFCDEQKKEPQKLESKLITEVENVNQGLDKEERCFCKIKQVKQDEKRSVLYLELVKNLSCACDELVQFISDSKHNMIEKGVSKELNSKSSETNNKNMDWPEEKKVTNNYSKNIFETTEGEESVEDILKPVNYIKYCEQMCRKHILQREIHKKLERLELERCISNDKLLNQNLLHTTENSKPLESKIVQLQSPTSSFTIDYIQYCQNICQQTIKKKIEEIALRKEEDEFGEMGPKGEYSMKFDPVRIGETDYNYQEGVAELESEMLTDKFMNISDKSLMKTEDEIPTKVNQQEFLQKSETMGMTPPLDSIKEIQLVAMETLKKLACICDNMAKKNSSCEQIDYDAQEEPIKECIDGCNCKPVTIKIKGLKYHGKNEKTAEGQILNRKTKKENCHNKDQNKEEEKVIFREGQEESIKDNEKHKLRSFESPKLLNGVVEETMSKLRLFETDTMMQEEVYGRLNKMGEKMAEMSSKNRLHRSVEEKSSQNINMQESKTTADEAQIFRRINSDTKRLSKDFGIKTPCDTLFKERFPKTQFKETRVVPDMHILQPEVTKTTQIVFESDEEMPVSDYLFTEKGESSNVSNSVENRPLLSAKTDLFRKENVLRSFLVYDNVNRHDPGKLEGTSQLRIRAIDDTFYKAYIDPAGNIAENYSMKEPPQTSSLHWQKNKAVQTGPSQFSFGNQSINEDKKRKQNGKILEEKRSEKVVTAGNDSLKNREQQPQYGQITEKVIHFESRNNAQLRDSISEITLTLSYSTSNESSINEESKDNRNEKESTDESCKPVKILPKDREAIDRVWKKLRKKFNESSDEKTDILTGIVDPLHNLVLDSSCEEVIEKLAKPSDIMTENKTKHHVTLSGKDKSVNFCFVKHLSDVKRHLPLACNGRYLDEASLFCEDPALTYKALKDRANTSVKQQLSKEPQRRESQGDVLAERRINNQRSNKKPISDSSKKTRSTTRPFRPKNLASFFTTDSSELDAMIQNHLMKNNTRRRKPHLGKRKRPSPSRRVLENDPTVTVEERKNYFNNWVTYYVKKQGLPESSTAESMLKPDTEGPS